MKFRDLEPGLFVLPDQPGNAFLKMTYERNGDNAVWVRDVFYEKKYGCNAVGSRCYFFEDSEVEPIELEWVDAGVFNRVR